MLRQFSQRFGLPNVKRKQRIQIPLVIAIVLFLPLLSTYTYYYVLMEADFLSARPKFENTDFNSLLLSKKHKVAVYSGFPYTLWFAGDLIEHSYCLCDQVALPQVKPLVLRC